MAEILGIKPVNFKETNSFAVNSITIDKKQNADKSVFINSLQDEHLNSVSKTSDNKSFFSEHKELFIIGGLALLGVASVLLLKNKNLIPKLFKKGKVDSKIPQVINKATGKKENLLLSDISAEILSDVKAGKNCMKKHIISAFVGDKEVGKMAISSSDVAGLRLYLPENQKSLYIDYLATSPEYKGIGKEMLKKAVKISQGFGYNGNVDLHACTGSLPSEFLKICGISKCNYSAALAYRKMGFESASNITNETLDTIIKNAGTGIVRRRDTLTGPMILSQDAIKKYLSEV